MKKIGIVALIGLCLILGACSSKEVSVGGGSDAEDLDEITIVLDWTPNTNHTGLYVAQAKGYFAQEGIKVTIEQPPEDGATALVGAGKAEFGIDFQDTLADSFASDTPVPVTAVAALIQHNTSGIISLADNNITSMKDMQGHTYATWDSPIEQATINSLVQADGGDPTKIEWLHTSVTDVIIALQADVDTVWVYYAWDGIATKLAGLDTNFINFADYGDTFDYYTPVLIANNSFLEEEPDLAKRALKAIQEGYIYAADNPDEAAKILLEAAPELDEDLVVASQEWLADKYIADAKNWGYIDQDRWDAFYAWLNSNDLVENPIESGYGFSDAYLPSQE